MEKDMRQEIISLKSQLKLKEKEINELKRKVQRQNTEIKERNFRIQELSYLISKGLEQ